MDVHTKAQRSYNMSRIRSINTKPELVVRRLCHAMGYRFRLHRKDLPGTPDLVFVRYKIVIFVNGCFWHRHTCKYGSGFPKSNIDFWRNKLDGKRKRDHRNWRKLRRQGWEVVVIWECQVKNQTRILSRIQSVFNSQGASRSENNISE